MSPKPLFFIKPGYIFEVRSWENDADNYVTARLDGLTELDVKFLAELCDAAKAGRNGSIDGIGNIHNDYARPERFERASNKLKSLIEKYQAASCVKALFDLNGDAEAIAREIESDDFDPFEVLYDLLVSIGMRNSDYSLRVCESYNVYFSSETHLFPNLTAKFSSK